MKDRTSNQFKETRLVLLTGSLNQGGAEHQMVRLAGELKDYFLYLSLLSLTNYTFYLNTVNELGINYKAASNEGNSIVRLYRILRLIRKQRPQLIIAYTKKASKVAILYRLFNLRKCKLIISERTSQFQPYKDTIHFILSHLANRIVFNSNVKLTKISGMFPTLKSRCIYIPNLISKEFYERDLYTIRSSDITKIKYIGRISPEKNIDNLVNAISLLARKNLPVSLTIIGHKSNSEYFNEINKKINILNLTDIIHFKSEHNELLKLYNDTDLVCVVSIFEGFSNVIAEANSSGIPVVASNIPENRELIRNGYNGFIVDPYSSQSIAEGIEKYICLNDADRSKISRNCREFALKHYHIANVKQKIISEIKEVLKYSQ